MESIGASALRPDIPPAALIALALWIASACVYLASSSVPLQICTAAAAACAVAGAVVSAVAVRRGVCAATSCAIGVLLGCACGFAGGGALHAARTAADAEPYQTFSLRAEEDASDSGFGSSFTATAYSESGNRYLVRVYLDQGETLVRYGDELDVRGFIEAPAASSAARTWDEGLVGTIAPTTVVHRGEAQGVVPLVALRNAAIDAMLAGSGSLEARGVLAGLVCGYRAGIDDDVYERFKLSGLAHVIAVSGSHLSLVAAMGAVAFRLLRIGRRATVVAHVALVASYLVVSGVPVSAVRSAVMASCGVASTLAWRRSSSINGWSVCVIVMVGLDPSCAVSASFVLSAASTASIVVFCGLATNWLERACRGHAPRAVTEPLALTLAASAGSLPLTAAYFSQIPTVSLLANLMAAPLFTLACGTGIVGCLAALATPCLAPFVLAPATLFSQLLCDAARLCAGIPYSCVPASIDLTLAVVATLALAVALYRAWPKVGAPALVAAMAAPFVAVFCAAVVVPQVSGNQIVALDVGQGDAILIQSEGATALVDTGNEDALLAAALARHGVVRLDALFVTHGDDDHCGSLRHLAGIVEIAQLFVARDALSCSCASCATLREDAFYAVGESCVVGLDQGDEVRLGGFSLDVVWPDAFEEDGGNADSLCLAARYARQDPEAEWTALLVGDAEAEQLSAMLASKAVGKVDVYKVGHHGSAAAITPELALALSPAVSVVSVGADNRYGHPAFATLEALEDAGSTIMRTDESGDVAVRFFSDRIEASTQRRRRTARGLMPRPSRTWLCPQRIVGFLRIRRTARLPRLRSR